MPSLGVARGGESHISTSFELSESSSVTTTSDLHWLCWTGTSCGTSLAGTASRSALSLEDVPSPCSDPVDGGCTVSLDVPTTVDCPGLSEEEMVGVSVSLNRSRGDSTVGRFVSGCSGAGVLAFLFPRSWLLSDGLLNAESSTFCSSLLDVAEK